MSPYWKRILNIAGGVLGLLGVVFVALRLRSYSDAVDFGRFNSEGWLLVVSLCLVYGAGNLFLAKAWGRLLSYFNISLKSRRVVRIYGLSQLAKYVPGNIFHLAGRQALGVAAGIPSGPLAKSSFGELGLMAIAGGSFFPLIVPLLGRRYLLGWQV